MSSETSANTALRPLPADPLEVGAAYAYPPGRPWVRANMIASIDGAAWWDGSTGALGNPDDHRLFSLLRALADVVIVGAGTVRDEDYGPARPGPGWPGLRKGRPSAPPLAVVSRALSLNLDAPIFTEAVERTILLTTEHSPPDRRAAAAARADVIICGEDEVDFAVAAAELAARGLTRVLCEGGPKLLAQVAAAGLLDELCLTISPVVLAGTPSRILDGPAVPKTATAMRLAGLLGSDDYLFLRYVRDGRDGGGAAAPA